MVVYFHFCSSFLPLKSVTFTLDWVRSNYWAIIEIRIRRWNRICSFIFYVVILVVYNGEMTFVMSFAFCKSFGRSSLYFCLLFMLLAISDGCCKILFLQKILRRHHVLKLPSHFGNFIFSCLFIQTLFSFFTTFQTFWYRFFLLSSHKQTQKTWTGGRY